MEGQSTRAVHADPSHPNASDRPLSPGFGRSEHPLVAPIAIPRCHSPMRLLLVEDKDSFRRLLVQALVGSSWDVLAVGDPEEAVRVLEGGAFEVMVTDLRLPGFSGLELLRRAKRLQPGLRVILMSAFGEPKDIVEAVRWGADDFLPKPFDLDVFLALLQRTAALVEAPPPDPREAWVANSPAMQHLDQGLAQAAGSDLPVLFTGEPGSGRGRTARRLHALRRPDSPYLALRADALPPGGPSPRQLDLLKGGSFYLQDLDLLPPDRIPGLVRAMGTSAGQYVAWMGGCRSSQDLPEPLTTRLAVLEFHLLPLAQRPEDVIPLFRAILTARARQLGRSVPLVDRSLERSLPARGWPGNVRELAWCVDQALQITSGPVLGPLPDPGAMGSSPLMLPLATDGTLEARLDAVRHHAEAAILRRELAAHSGDLGTLAQRLGLTPRTLAQRLREHAIPLEDTP